MSKAKPSKAKPSKAKPSKAKPSKSKAKPRKRAPKAKHARGARSPGPSRAKQKALDRMADLAGAPLRVESAEATRFALWQLKATFYLPQGSTYDTVSEILDRWDSDGAIRRGVGPKSTCRIQVAWDQGRGRSGEYTLAEIGTFDFALSRSLERVDVRDGDKEGLAERYGIDGNTSAITRLYVWLGADVDYVT